MKNKYISLLVALASFFSATSQNYNITFQVDMSTVDPATFTTPEVNGTFNGWCGGCAAMTDANGDNIWDVTISMAAGSYEFKFSADNWGIQESLLPGSPCTVTNFGFTNRILNVSGDTTLSAVCWESCDDCASGPTAYDVTFELDMRGVTQSYTTPEVNGDFNGWCGNCWQMTDTDGDSIWQFQMLFAPGDSLEWKYSADNWNIQEDLDSSLSCIIINYDPGAPNGYGFVNRVAVVNSDTTFSSPWNFCTSLLSVPGCTDSTALNYNPLATIDDSSCIYCVYGCMDSLACNYDPTATCDDGSCLSIYGCTDSLATNYDPLATCPDSCIFTSSTSSLISACDDFDAGPTAWPYVLVASTVADGASSQLAQTFTMNVIDTASGASFRVAKTTANGNWFFGPAIALTLGSNSITVAAVTFDRAVKFQFSSGDPEFDFLSLNGDTSSCVIPPPPPPPSTSSLISTCDDFDAGPTAWPYVLVAATVADGASSQLAQTFTMNVTDTVNGANFRVAKTVANGNWFFGPAIALTLGSNSITVAAVTFDRAVKFQFSSGDPEFDFLSLNGDTSSCVALATLGCTDSTALNYNPLATIDDSSCIYCVYGCMDSLACNYDPTATCDDGSCLSIYGCTDTLACNYDPAATCDDGSCLSIYGCTDSLATNYDPLATCEDSTCVYGYYVTFQLDLKGVTSITYTTPEVNGMFNGWCGSCNPLEDLDGDSIWETTLLIDPGTYEFKYSVDNFTTEENLFAGDSCTVSNFGFTNRTITVDRDTVLAPVCWELCGDCDSGPSSYNVTFRLDMSEYVGPPYTTPEVNGTFNNWCGSCWAMEDANGDNVWEFTALIGAGDSIQFKYSADNWNIQEDLDSSLSCVFVGFDPSAPNGWGYVNRLEVIDSEKVLDVVCWQECVECQGTSSFGDSPTGNLLLYPNPSTGSVIIRSPENISRCTVYSVLGETISSEEMAKSTNEYKINIVKNGLYYVSIHTEKGVFTNKITIQK